MKKLLILAVLATLGGCATGPYNNTPYYGSTVPQNGDPSQWHVVSVTPVAPGTSERIAASSSTGSSVEYSSTPVQVVQQPIYVQQPVYVPQPLYAPQPYYYYPPVSLGLSLGFGRSWGGHSRGWGGVGIGSHWHR
ncbi:MAG: hypothetical protein ABIT83_23745 [Massilia sp.]